VAIPLTSSGFTKKKNNFGPEMEPEPQECEDPPPQPFVTQSVHIPENLEEEVSLFDQVVGLHEKLELLAKERNSYAEKCEALEAKNISLEDNCNLLVTENESIKVQLQNCSNDLQREKKEVEVFKNQKTEVRIQRVAEDVEKYKNAVKEIKNMERDMVSKKQYEKIVSENIKLEKLNKEYANVIQKQSQMIQLLKQQVLHIESAIRIKITEDEFLQVYNKT
jgi:hypothetical protein